MKNAACYGISTDASNHNAEKIFPVVLQYFCHEKGLQVKLFRVASLPNEKSETIAQLCTDTLENHGTDGKKNILQSAGTMRILILVDVGDMD